MLGTSCKSNTIACTSNHKFLPLKAQVYMKQYTYMMQYPGNEHQSSFSNILPKSEEHVSDQTNTIQLGKQCKNC